MTATREDDGGIERWLRLTDGARPRPRLCRRRRAGILPATRFAVDAYVTFVRERSLLEAIASSLTELFSPQIIGERVSRHAGALRLRHAGDARLFHAAAGAGAARRRFRARLCAGACPHGRSSSRRCWTRCASSATCSGRSSTRWTRLCRTAHVAARRLAPDGRAASDDAAPRPRSRMPPAAPAARRAACSEDEARGGLMLLAPERVLQPTPIAAEILKRCDGDAHASARSSTSWPRSSRRRASEIAPTSSALLAGSRRQAHGGRVNETSARRPTIRRPPPPPLGILAELTHRCPLRCPYCSNPLELDARSRELDTDDWKRVFSRGRRARRAAGPPVRRRADGAARHRRADRALRARGRPLHQPHHLRRSASRRATLDAPRRGRARPRPALAPGRRRRDAPTASRGYRGAPRTQARGRAPRS